MKLSEAALQYVDVPFRHMGRTLAGLDCAGLLLLAAKDCGYEAEDTPIYDHQPRDGHMFETLLKHACKVVNRPPEPNDVVVSALRPGGPAVHVGVVTKHPYGLGVVHTYGHIGRVIHQRLDEKKMGLISVVMEFKHG